MVTAHIGRNARRYAIGAGATAAGAVAAKPAGKQAGKASVGKSDPYYDMNRRAGESIFHSRKSKIDSSRLKKSGMRESHTPGHFATPQRYVSVKSSDGSKPNPAQMRAFAKLAHSGRRREGIEEAGSRTFGKGLGRAGRYAKLKLQPDEGLGKAIGAATSKTLRSIKPGTKQIVPAAATVGAAGIIGKRAKAGAEQGQYDKRRSGTQQGYTDAYKKTYGRKEGIDEGYFDPSKDNREQRITRNTFRRIKGKKPIPYQMDEANVAGGIRKIAGKLKSVKSHPAAQKAQQSIRWGGRGVAALDLAVLGASGTAAGIKAVHARKNREEGLDEARTVRRLVKKGLKPLRNRLAVKTNQARYLRKPSGKRYATAKGTRHLARAAVGAEIGAGAVYAGGAAGAAYGIKKKLSKKREEGLDEGRIKGSGLRKIGGYIEKGDVGLFGISTGRAITNKGRDVADDQQLNQSHLRRK